MPFWDSTDWSDPQTMAAMQSLGSMAGSFADSAMPSRLPVPLGAVLGHAGQAMTQGATSGAAAAQAFKTSNQDIAGKAITNDQSLIMENLLRRALGQPELTQKDLTGSTGMATRSPIFGLPTPQAANDGGAVAPGQGQGMPSGGVPGGSPLSAATAAPAMGAPPPQQGGPAGGPGTTLGNNLVMKMLGFAPTDYAKAKQYADMLPEGPAKVEAERAAAKIAGVSVTAPTRAGESINLWNPNKQNDDGTIGGYDEALRNPNLSPDIDYDPKTHTAGLVPGAAAAVGKLADISAHAKAGYTPITTYDQAGNETILPATALHDGAASGANAAPVAPGFAARVSQLESSGNPNPPPNSASSAAGTDQFLNSTWLDQAKAKLPPQLTQGKTDQQILAMRSNPQVSAFLTNSYAADNAKALQSGGIKNVGAPELYLAHHFGSAGAQAILKAPVNTPLSQVLSPQVMQANPDLAGATVGDIYSHSRQAMHGVVAPSSGPSGALAAGAPNTPVQHSASGIPTKLDDFLGGLGPNYQPPGRPAVPAGALMGEPGKGTEEIQKADGDRLEQYSKEASGGQKVYTNLQQLYQIMGRGLSTGNMTAAATHLTNYAHQLGMDSLIPPKFDPSDSGAFNKLATDLVFAQLKQIGGRPMVSEIEGLKQANPNTSLTPQANTEILNNILADQRWRDSRADLGRQYMARFGSLGDFDARFNEQYPEVDTYNRVAGAAAKSGWKMPGDASTRSGQANGATSAAADPKVQAMITPAAIHATALKYGHTDAQVKAALQAKGYSVQ